jgi:hypothetical protein
MIVLVSTYESRVLLYSGSEENKPILPVLAFFIMSLVIVSTSYLNFDVCLFWRRTSTA